jgi:uncharacterized membrane protein YraQ (UPF0718 family)/YHS domain-containing protein
VVTTLRHTLDWLGSGFKESLAMLWMTWWPIVFGFTLSGFVQSFLPRDGLRAKLGTTSPSSTARASLLGIISSSCSYAASAMARALFARGASWTNSIVFMVASTNLVIELGVVLYLLLGWQFVLAQFVGGAIMIVAITALAGLFFSTKTQERLRERVLADTPPAGSGAVTTWRQRLRTSSYYRLSARYTMGDFTMLRKELIAGFVVAGFLSVHVPSLWWNHVFITGHGSLTVLENALVAPLLAVISFVCSVGNIPLAAALWSHGVAFGGVVSFIFADLVTLPLLLIYRRFYGARAAFRLFLLLWLVMSAGGLIVNVIFNSSHLLPTTRHSPALSGQFPMGATLVLNILAAFLLIGVWLLSRRTGDAEGARDPMCGMTVDTSAPVATRTRDGVMFYFCSLRCAERFDHQEESSAMHEDLEGDQIDPVCGMRVSSTTVLSGVGPDNVTYYFCSEGCRRTFLEGPSSPPDSQPIELGRKPSHE